VKLRAVAAKILDDISAIAKVVQDVAKVPRMFEPQRMTEFM
jgi:hypothetical protein